MSLISGNVIFGAGAMNCSSNSILGGANFIETASNKGVVSLATFSAAAVNEGTAISAVFTDGAVNIGTLTSGIFLGTAVNSGVVTVAEFFGTASNVGVIVEAAKFADTSSNVGIVSGSAIFADTSISNGVVEGAVQLGANVTEGENQALTETPTEYTQPDGYFPNQYYNGGIQAVPADYDRKVYQVNGFWYKYNNNGNGQLANGNYHDGANWFGFTDGVKTLNINFSITSYSIVLSNTNYYYASTLQNGERLYLDSLLINEATNLSILSTGVDLNSDGAPDDLVTDASGTITITYGNPNDPDGTFIRAETIYITINGTQYENGTKDIVADGNGGERDGNNNYLADGVILGVSGNETYVADGNGGYSTQFPADGTFIRNETVYISIEGGSYENGNEDIVANGAGGEKTGTYYPAAGGTEFARFNHSVTYNGTTLSSGERVYTATGSSNSNAYNLTYTTANGTLLGNVGGTDVYADGNGGYYV
jgi:hypothetical protein